MSHLTDQCDMLRDIFTDSLWTYEGVGRWHTPDGHKVRVQYCMADVTIDVYMAAVPDKLRYRGVQPVTWVIENLGHWLDMQVVPSIVNDDSKHEHTESVNKDEEASNSSCNGRRTDLDARTLPRATGFIRL